MQVVERDARHPHHRGADEHDGHHAARRLANHDHDALVHREQIGDVRDGVHVDRPQLAGDVGRRGDRAVYRHVHAVVVLRRQVQRDEAAALEPVGERAVSEQRGEGVVPPLRLDQHVVGDDVGA